MNDFTVRFMLDGKALAHQTQIRLDEVSWAAIGGCEAARVFVSGGLNALWMWTTRLMAHVEIYAPDAILVWSGVLWGVTVRTPVGTFDYSMDKVANRVAVQYSYETGGGVGERAETDWAEDADSMVRYGTIEKYLSISGATPDAAEGLRARYLASYAWPQAVSDPNTSVTQAEAEMVLFGHWARTAHLIYGDAEIGQEDTATIAQRIAGQFGFIEDTSSLVQASGLSTTRHRDDSHTGQFELDALAEIGTAAGERVLVGIDERKRFYFKPADGEVTYYYRDMSVLNLREQAVQPWAVRPGTWLQQLDVVTPVLQDVRPPGRLFVERVTMRRDPDDWNVEIEPLDAQSVESLIVAGLQ